jgi:glucose 1-dehydrogenase
MQRLEGKTAVITGASSGIGQATAIAFAREGANVVINYHSNEEGAHETLKKVEEAGQKGLIYQADVSKEAEVNAMMEKARQTFGEIYILVNNAAMNASGVLLKDMETEQWNKIIAVNLSGPFLCSRWFVRHRLEKGGKGKLINVSSVHEHIPMVGAADYDASKGALQNLMRTLALEVGEQQICVNNIAPGMILTPMNQQAIDDPDKRKQQTQNIPMKRAGKPEEVAALAVYLASEDSDYCTGATFTIDGGLTQNTGQGA